MIEKVGQKTVAASFENRSIHINKKQWRFLRTRIFFKKIQKASYRVREVNRTRHKANFSCIQALEILNNRRASEVFHQTACKIHLFADAAYRRNSVRFILCALDYSAFSTVFSNQTRSFQADWRRLTLKPIKPKPANSIA